MKLGFDWQFREARLGEASACDAELGSTHKKWPEHNAGTCLILFYLSMEDPEGGLSIRVLVSTHSPTTLDLGAGPADQERDTGALRVQQTKKSTQCVNVVQVVGCLAVELTMFSYVQNPQG